MKTAGFSALPAWSSWPSAAFAFECETLDFVWIDGEPPSGIYTERLTRTNAPDGLVWMTFTPLQGMSELVFIFKDCPGF